MIRSQIVIRLANLASSGTYEVQPAEAAAMTELYSEVAKVINSLEEEEKGGEANKAATISGVDMNMKEKPSE